MENNTNISDRIKELIEYKGVSINKFAEKVGASNSYFNKVIKNNTTIGSDKIENILHAFPEVNPTWLIMGKGKMIIDINLGVLNKINNHYDYLSFENINKENELLKERVSIQQQTISMLKDKIELLELQIEKKKVDKSFFNSN